MNRKSLSALVTLGVLLFGAALLPAMAQQTTPVPTVSATTTASPGTARMELYGVIEQVTATTITVNGQTYSIAGVYIDDDVQLVVGETVELELVQRGGAWLLVEIDDVDDDDRNRSRSELHGILDSINGTTIVVSGIAVDISGAVIEDALVVGMPVEVYLTLGANGQWVATRVERDDDRDSGNDDRGGRGSDDDNDDRGSGSDDRGGRGSDDDDDADDNSGGNQGGGQGNSGGQDDDNDDDSGSSGSQDDDDDDDN
jgi:hypothetical protein